MHIDDGERAMLVNALTGAVRGVGDGSLRASLAAVGWDECLEAVPETAVSTVLRLQGEHLTDATMLDDVVLAAMGRDAEVVVYPALGAIQPTSQVLTSSPGSLVIDGLLAGSPDGDAPTVRALVPALTESGVVLALVPALPRAVHPPVGMDLGRGWQLLRRSTAMDDVELVEGPEAAAAWEAGRAAGLRAIACELHGVSTAMLRLAVEHTTTRRQFGRTLAEFQVVKHKLADVRIWLEATQLAVDAALEDGDVVSAALAKSLAVRASRTARENCQQVLGGMGFSWEHPLHRYIRRALLLEPLLGSAAALRTDVGRDVLTTAALPSLAPL